MPPCPADPKPKAVTRRLRSSTSRLLKSCSSLSWSQNLDLTRVIKSQDRHTCTCSPKRLGFDFLRTQGQSQAGQVLLLNAFLRHGRTFRVRTGGNQAKPACLLTTSKPSSKSESALPAGSRDLKPGKACYNNNPKHLAEFSPLGRISCQENPLQHATALHPIHAPSAR